LTWVGNCTLLLEVGKGGRCGCVVGLYMMEEGGAMLLLADRVSAITLLVPGG
jgi:hypothetical protein